MLKQEHVYNKDLKCIRPIPEVKQSALKRVGGYYCTFKKMSKTMSWQTSVVSSKNSSRPGGHPQRNFAFLSFI